MAVRPQQTAAALGAALQRPRRRLILPMVQLQQQALNPQDFSGKMSRKATMFLNMMLMASVAKQSGLTT